MTYPTVSVVVVSRHRPMLLLRCLDALNLQLHVSFEVIVVADSASVGAVNKSRHSGNVKIQQFDDANISAARNTGIALAAGEIVAFIDDDAVAEPGWLHHLCAPFCNTRVAAVTGYVRGRNGISYQWKTVALNDRSEEFSVDHAGESAVTFMANGKKIIKLHGTNSAYRRRIFTQLGGFDPAFHFYMDDTDLSTRVSHAGHCVAVSPLAQVHHGFSHSIRRRSDRMPLSLFDVGASSMMYFRKYLDRQHHDAAVQKLISDQKVRLIDFMNRGICEPRDVVKTLKTLTEGLDTGRSRSLQQPPKISLPSAPFLPFSSTIKVPRHEILAGYHHRIRMLEESGMKAVENGAVVSLYVFSRTALFHHVRFHSGGFWIQTGGLFGRSKRAARLFQFHKFAERVEKEALRVEKVRFPELAIED